ncbi:MAG: flagellar biosynthetic protein FliR, partial [Pseudomonadota bacterium]
VLTMVVAPVIQTPVSLDVLSAAGLVTVIQEIAIGIVMGFLVQLVFDAIALGGQVISLGMGLGFAVFIDRANGVNTPVLGQLFLMLGMLVFLAIDGHLTMILLLSQSFQTLPIGASGLSLPLLAEVLAWTANLFVFALKIALPAITAILVVNLSFGVMSRAAPTLNLFAVGFPITMLLGFLVIFLNMGVLVESITLFLNQSMFAISQMLES